MPKYMMEIDTDAELREGHLTGIRGLVALAIEQAFTPTPERIDVKAYVPRSELVVEGAETGRLITDEPHILEITP